MSTAHVDISADLITGIFAVLDGEVTYGGVEVPVYKTVPKAPPELYVYIGDVLQDEDGTKDDFVYYGTVQIIVCDAANMKAIRERAQAVLNTVRGLLKPARLTTFSCGGRTLITFTPGPLNFVEDLGDTGKTRIRLVDIYNFLIE
jgi:hypothetical protein